jgi:hypothetical protein
VDIAAWLRGLGLEQYEPAFRTNEIDDEPGEWSNARGTEVRRLAGGGKRIRTVGSAMRSYRRQRCRGVTPPDPGGERRLLGPPLDNSIGMARPATARMTGECSNPFPSGGVWREADFFLPDARTHPGLSEWSYHLIWSWTKYRSVASDVMASAGARE